MDLHTESTKEILLDNIRPARRELDKIIMGDIFGLSEAEQLEVYRAVIDLVKARVNKAQTFGKRKKSNDWSQIEDVKNNIVTIIKDGI